MVGSAIIMFTAL